MTRIVRTLLTLLSAGLAVTACGSGTPAASTGDTAGEAPSVPASTVNGDLTVFAAASLTSAFDEIGAAFMAENPDVTVTFNYAGSSDLATQINEGAPADVFASADAASMTRLTDAGNNRGEPEIFAANTPQIIVAAGNPKAIATVADLADPDTIVVLCAPEVPCGKYAGTILSNAEVAVTPRSQEQNVKAVVSKVTAGEADAGIVYATDVIAAGDAAEGVDIAADVNVIARYPMVATRESVNPGAATAFIEFVRSEEGQQILGSYGFLQP
ncbi:MAG: molybdate ABC transporter substrate-binding protein [Acidimicrobiales bacterium]